MRRAMLPVTSHPIDPRRTLRLLLLLVVAAFGGASGCAKGTYLELHLVGEGLPEVYGVRMALTLRPGSDKPLHSVDVIRADKNAVIKLPTTVAFSLDDYSGALQLDATALGRNDAPVASGSVLTTIMTGETWGARIDLTPL
jgi:hypothetical protein